MLDFTSSLYLGFRHPSRSLRPWAQLTEGVPAALREPAAARRIAAGLAGLTGLERAILARSTLHAFWDLFTMISGLNVAVFLDSGAYPVARWGAEHAAARGVPVHAFPHHDADGLRSRLDRFLTRGGRPVVVSDGFCPGCGKPAPLSRYLASLRSRRGLLLVDDTQALGVLGRSPGARNPLGFGGGGSLRHQGVAGDGVVVVSSLAKGFGAPLAMIGGDGAWIDRLERGGKTRVHCSPPSHADLNAAAAALEANESRGEALRARLTGAVRRLRRGVLGLGLRLGPTCFPVQTIRGSVPGGPERLHHGLSARGVRTVLQLPACRPVPTVTFLVTAGHRIEDVDRALAALREALTGEGAARKANPRGPRPGTGDRREIPTIAGLG